MPIANGRLIENTKLSTLKEAHMKFTFYKLYIKYHINSIQNWIFDHSSYAQLTLI